jgi:hypothetical protein
MKDTGEQTDIHTRQTWKNRNVPKHASNNNWIALAGRVPGISAATENVHADFN